MHTVRELPFAEWHRVAPLLDREFPGNVLPPAPSSAIIVAEDENGAIIGFWFALTVTHLEPVWIHPSHRGSTLAAAMWKRMKQLLDDCRIPVAFCFSDTPIIANYLQRLGLRRLPFETYLYGDLPECSDPPK